MHIVSHHPFVNGNNQVFEDLSSEPSDAERLEARLLADAIRSALRRTPKLSIRQLANRWPWYFRGGGLIAELSDDPDDDHSHKWRGMTRIAVLALDILDDERITTRSRQHVPAVFGLRRIDRTEPTSTPSTEVKA
jgi:hypothetical protein